MDMKLIVLMFALLMYATLSSVTGKLITCSCTTEECHEQRTDRCNTTSMCYTQYLDRRDGSNPILRGCISSRTPLLCENRRPAVMNANWPVLVCCSTNMCNQDAVPTTPTWHPSEGNLTETDIPIQNASATRQGGATNATASGADHTQERTIGSDVRFNPIYVAIIMVAAITLLAVIIVVYLFCRKGRLFPSDCNSVQRGSYLKGHHQVAREDSEIPLPLPRQNGIYDNKMAVKM